jgi:hypothetical protein
MSPQALQMRRLYRGTTLSTIDISVEAPAAGVAIVDATISCRSSSVPIHWRAGDWTKPPLDISLSHEGRIEGIQIVFQDEKVPIGGRESATKEESGIPSFDVGAWSADRYLDVHTSVRSVRLPSGELLVSIGDDKPLRTPRLGGSLRVGLDASDRLVEVILGPLDAQQWEMIDAAGQ